jgi:hypothetical protein
MPRLLPGMSCEQVVCGSLMPRYALNDALPDSAKWISFNSRRTLVLDVLHFARAVPYFPVERVFDLSDLVLRREAAQPRIAWSVLFLKAFACVIARHPALRRYYAGWPWPHLVESNDVVAVLAVSREDEGQERLCWASFRDADQRTLVDLNDQLRGYQTRPVEEAFKKQVALSRLPTLLRRLILWWNLNFGGRKRARRLGTFSLSTLAGQHSLNRGHPSILTSSLTYGPLDERGRATVTLLCDHRVLDGMLAAEALADLEIVLHREISGELGSLARAKAA